MRDDIMPKFVYKIFHRGSDVLLAISDADIIGKTFCSGNMEITVTKEFYSEKSCGEKEIPALVKKATIVNAIGKGIVSLLSSRGFLDAKNIIMIGEVPHAQVVSL